MEQDPKAFRRAATVLLVRDDPFEVLMVRRHSGATAFASRLVFPGGVLEPDDADPRWLPLVTGAEDLSADERAVRICAIRETWEETAILIGADGAPAPRPDASFLEIVAETGIRLPLDGVHPFAHWVTPEAEARRFDTRFFLAVAPAGQSAVADGGETVGLEWVQPGDATDSALIFPTIMNLRRLAESSDSASAIAAAAARTPYTVRPVLVRNADDEVTVTIPAEAGYGITSFVHR